jgi:hypothetical protein
VKAIPSLQVFRGPFWACTYQVYESTARREDWTAQVEPEQIWDAG